MTSTRPLPRETFAAQRRSAARKRVLATTRDYWEPRMGRSLSDDEAGEIADNLLGFFELLAKWERRAAEREQKGS